MNKKLIRTLLDQVQNLIDMSDNGDWNYPWLAGEIQEAVDAVEDYLFEEEEQEYLKTLTTVIYDPVYNFYNVHRWNDRTGYTSNNPNFIADAWADRHPEWME